MDNDNKAVKEENKNEINLEQKDGNRNTNKWYVINIVLFFISIIFFNISMSVFGYLGYLFNLDEYTFALSMIFFWPILVFLFGWFMMGLGITALVFEIISMSKIIKGSKNKVFKVIIILEICIYVIYILSKIFL